MSSEWHSLFFQIRVGVFCVLFLLGYEQQGYNGIILGLIGIGFGVASIISLWNWTGAKEREEAALKARQHSQEK